MSKSTMTIPAESGQTCSCCGRTHRKLTLIDGMFLGQNCREDYVFIKNNPNASEKYLRFVLGDKKYNRTIKLVK